MQMNVNCRTREIGVFLMVLNGVSLVLACPLLFLWVSHRIGRSEGGSDALALGAIYLVSVGLSGVGFGVGIGLARKGRPKT